MSELKSTCCCRNTNKDGTTNSYRRTIRSNPKLRTWDARNNSVQMNEILTSGNCEPKAECTCVCDKIQPDEVTKTAGKIKWTLEKPPTNSKYHGRCVSRKQPRPKSKKPNNIKRNVVPSNSCTNCVDPSKRKFINECYCGEPPDKPFLPVKPAVTQPNTKKTIRSGLTSPDDEVASNHNLETLRKAKQLLQGYAPESEFLRRLQKEAKAVYDCTCSSCKTKEETASLKYTMHRHFLEDAYKEVEKNKQYSMEEIARQSHKCEIQSDSCVCRRCNTSQRAYKASQNTSQNVTTLSPQYSLETSPKSSIVNDCDKIHEIKRIRDDNYFETHSTNVNLVQNNIPPHKCVHKFTLDDRLLPKPLNSDNYGVSRCTKCNKAMETNSVSNEEVLYTVDYEKVPDKPRVDYKEDRFAKVSQTVPRRISLPSKNNTVELHVPSILITEQKNINVSRMRPTNSWALRYQKGVM